MFGGRRWERVGILGYFVCGEYLSGGLLHDRWAKGRGDEWGEIFYDFFAQFIGSLPDLCTNLIDEETWIGIFFHHLFFFCKIKEKQDKFLKISKFYGKNSKKNH